MSIPKLIEDAVTILLREELEKRGVKALPVSISTPQGYRKPDLLCENAGVYPIEAKFREKDLLKAVAKIQNDYIKFYDILGIKGGFALLYPEELSKPMPLEAAKELAYKLKFKAVAIFPPKDKRNFTVYEGYLTEIAEILAEHILTPPEYVEPSVEYIIKTLREAATHITEALKHLTGEQLEDLFGGKHVFKNILQYEEGRYPVESLRLASAYLLVNQLLFYHVLSRRMPEKFPELDPDTIEHPSDLNKYFKKVLDVNYRAILSYDVASRIPQKYLDQVKVIINAVKALSPEKVGGDLLGTIFHDLVPFDVRKSVAAFYTNVLVAELLAWLAIDRYNAKVADFACGSGGLLVASYRRKRYLLEREKSFTQEDHRRFVEEELLGVDVMPFAANVAACHLALQSPEYFTNRVNIAIWDSTELSPGRVIPSIAGLKFVLAGQTNLEMFTKSGPEVKGVVSLTGEKPEEIKLETYDVVIMNPPFTRQERMSREYKDKLFERFKNYKDNLHGQLGYYGYFILLADKFLKEGGRVALVLPASILKVRSSEGIRELLAEKYSIEYLISGKGRLNFSESAWKREILLVARKISKKEEIDDVVIASLSRLPSNLMEVREFAHKLKEAKKLKQYSDENLSAITINWKEVKREYKNWFKYIATYDPRILALWKRFEEKVEKKLIRFGDLLQRENIQLKRGIETSRGMRVQVVFILRDASRARRREDVWVLKEIKGKHIIVGNRFVPHIKLKIPIRSVAQALRTIAGNESMDVTEKTDYVVIKDFADSEKFFFGERIKFKDVLPTWENYVKDRAGNLIILRRFVIPVPGTIHLCYYSSTPTAGPGMTWVASNLKDVEAKILCLWFNSSFYLAQILLNKVEDVWVDIHRYILEDLLVLDPSALHKEQRELLTSLFDSLRNINFPSLKSQFDELFHARMEIDRAIMKMLGFEEAEINRMLSELYDAIKNEFSILHNLMTERS